MILKRPRLRLVGVADEVARYALGLGEEAPLHAHREARAAAAPNAGFFGFFHHFLRRHGFDRLLHGLVAPVLPVSVEGFDAFDVGVF